MACLNYLSNVAERMNMNESNQFALIHFSLRHRIISYDGHNNDPNRKGPITRSEIAQCIKLWYML